MDLVEKLTWRHGPDVGQVHIIHPDDQITVDKVLPVERTGDMAMIVQLILTHDLTDAGIWRIAFFLGASSSRINLDKLVEALIGQHFTKHCFG